MKMINLLVIPFLFSLYSCTSGDTPRPLITPPVVQDTLEWAFEKTPSWSDEFDYSGLPDPKKWDYDIGGNGWGNNELQYYTKELKNAKVEDGVLKITAIKEAKEGKEYTSSRLVSRKKGDFLYGRFEVRVKLPKGTGTWPAVWMMPTESSYGGWPRSGEIDIIEHVGFDQDKIHMSVHTQAYNHIIGTQKTNLKFVPGVSDDFHLYRLDWTPSSITGFIDNVKLFEFVNDESGFESWPFDKKFYFLFNIAVGGNWGGAQGVDPNVFPQTLEVDYVRVYDIIEK